MKSKIKRMKRAPRGNRFLSLKEMRMIKWDDSVYASRVKRGEFTDHAVREQHYVCGCGALGCVGISRQKEK